MTIIESSAPADVERIAPTSRRGRLLLLAVLGLALLLRLAVVASTHADYRPLNDAAEYDKVAALLADRQGYPETAVPGASGPSAFRAPGYPLALGAVYMITGHHWTAGLLENAVIGTAVVALIGLVAAQLFGRRVGAIALVIAAVHPTLVLIGSGLQIEPLLVALELGAIGAALQHRRRPAGWRWPVVAGLCLGFALLTRELGIWLVPTLALLLWVERPRWSRTALTPPLVALGVGALVVLPWTVRNASTFHAFVPVTTTSGVGLAGTYNQSSFDDDKDPELWRAPWFDPGMGEVILAHQGEDEAQLDKVLRSEAISFATHHPSAVPKAMFWNTVRMFDLQGPEHALFIRRFIPYSEKLTRMAVYASYAVWLAAIAALFLRAARRVPWAVALFPVLVWFNLAILSGNIRYRASIEPFAVILASVLVSQVWRRRKVPAVAFD